MATHRDYLYRFDAMARRLSILDPDTMEEVGFVQAPAEFTMADVELFRAELLKLAKSMAAGPN